MGSTCTNGEHMHMSDKPPPPDSMPGIIKDRKPKGVEGERALERISRKLPPVPASADGEKKAKKKRPS